MSASPSAPPASGFLDLHSHLLPGIDDGCRSFDDSVACVRRLLAHGFTGTVCTPHVYLQEFPDNVPVRIARRVAELAARLRDHGLDYPLYAGGEVRIVEETVCWFEEHGVPTLGAGRCVLVDYWGHAWPGCGDAVFDYLLDNGYQPILAHPERMNLDEDALEGLLDCLRGRGVWLQGNLNSLAGREGPRARERMLRWLARDLYHLVATDMHRPTDMDGRMDGIRDLERAVGAEQTRLLLQDRPREIVAGG